MKITAFGLGGLCRTLIIMSLTEFLSLALQQLARSLVASVRKVSSSEIDRLDACPLHRRDSLR